MIGWAVVALGIGIAGVSTMAVSGTMSVRRVDLYRWVAQRRPGASAAGLLLNVPARLFRAGSALATLGATLIGVGLAAALAPLSPAMIAVAMALLVIPVLLVVTVAMPRVLGAAWGEAIVRGTVPWLNRLAYLVAPLGHAAGRPLGSVGHARPTDSEDAGADDELKVLAGVLAFTERSVRDVMQPRTEIVAAKEGSSLQEIALLFEETGYSRIPVYRDSLDDILGMIYVFDLLKIGPGAELPIRPVVTVPASKRCAELLAELQRDRRQFAVVLDEYGGTAGIVTFEDLLEELVGEIFDEYDRNAPGGQTVVDILDVTGATPIHEIEARFDVTIDSHAETVGGLLAGAIGRIPQAGDRYTLGGLEFDVLGATPNRVGRVVVRRGPTPLIRLDR